MSSDPLPRVRSIDGMMPQQHPASPQAPTKPKPRLRRRKLLLWGGLSVVILGAAVTGISIFAMRSTSPLPTIVTKQAGFPLYYPSSMPSGYHYEKGSAKLNGGVVFYTLQSDADTIAVSEQAAPAYGPNLSQLAGFTSLKTLAGKAVVGTTSTKQPTAIIVSNTTLISITGQQNTPSDVVAQVAQSMRSLPPQ